MKEAMQWWQEIKGNDGTWLVVGKGPSFEKRGDFDLQKYRTLSLNHVVREIPVEVASIIDIDVVRDCAEAIDANARFLLMPRFPHVNCNGSDRNLESYFSEIPVLQKLSDEGRLIWYNLSSAPAPVAGSPVIPQRAFSGAVVVTLLGELGARTIRTLGLDGGQKYAGKFSDLEKTRLANGKSSFDSQSRHIAEAIQKYSLDCGPLTSEVPMRLFIGTDESQLLGARVLEYSVRKHSSITSTFDNMLQVRVPFPKDPKNQPRTGFSFNRFAIPELAGYKGRAVYVDADMLVFRDFRELWDIPFDGAQVLYAPSSSPARLSQFSVLLLNCDELRWNPEEIVQGLDEGRYDYDGLMKEMCIVPPGKVRDTIPSDWNSLEEYTPEKTGLIHYTDMKVQPWVSRRNGNGDIWVRYLKEALDTGFVTQEEFAQARKHGFMRPSLPIQLKLPEQQWPTFRKTVARALDSRYRAHKDLNQRLTQFKAATQPG